MSDQIHGGRAVSGALEALGVDHLFTLTGGHIFPILDGAHQDGIRIVDTRHEQAAAFAAEAWARLTRTLGVCSVTAGPGVTNALSPLAQAGFNSAPVLCLAGRAPGFRWGQGSLQEIDHVPFVDPLAPARTVTSTEEIAADVFAAARDALTPPRGPRFLDFPLEVLFNNVEAPDFEVPGVGPPAPSPPAEDVASVAQLLAAAERPVILAGSNVWLDGAEAALRELVEAAEVPAFTNGQGRGCLPADHRLSFSRCRGQAFKEADLVVVAGAPMDFRLGFGQGFAPGARIVHLDSHPDLLAPHVELAAAVGAPLGETFAALASELSGTPDTKPWIEVLRATEDSKRDAAQGDLRSSSAPIHPLRVYGDLVPLLDRDAIVICDGGDFASYAGREIPSYEPGSWLDTGPFGCLGVGPGYAMAARLAHPDRQVVVMYGDGAVGFSGMELETLVRLGLPVVCVVGNNGIWALEKYPMQALYGYDVAAELRPGIRYDRVMEAFGGRGFFVTDPDELAPALKSAFDCGEPALVNVVTDPSVAYPRSSNLA
ncbi:MAG: acetolactate synthase [Actinomycetota bacterium]|nr:acetolactate synthase [Actinomycetota bacterium]